MFGIPYEKVIIQSKLEPSQIVTRLEAVTSRFLWYKWPPKEKEFVGSISPDGFRIHRNIRNRNTYLPFLVGKVRASNEGSQIVVTISLHTIAIFIMLALFLYVFRVAIISGGDVEFTLFCFSGFFVFHLLMYVIGFLPEVSWAKERCRK